MSGHRTGRDWLVGCVQDNVRSSAIKQRTKDYDIRNMSCQNWVVPYPLSDSHIYIVSWVNIFNLDFPEKKTHGFPLLRTTWNEGHAYFQGTFHPFLWVILVAIHQPALDFPCWLASTWQSKSVHEIWQRIPSFDGFHPSSMVDSPTVNNSGFCCRLKTRKLSTLKTRKMT